MSALQTQTPSVQQPPAPTPGFRPFYPALNGVRGFAALLVFLFHYTFKLNSFLRIGWVGVDLFFVLSGFLITGILYDTRLDANRFHTFYLRRSLRIFPLYYSVLLILLLLTLVFHWRVSASLALVPFYLLNFAPLLQLLSAHPDHILPTTIAIPGFAQPLFLNHLWTLALEEQFYMIWPFVVFTLRDRVRLRNLCLAAALIMPALRVIFLANVHAAAAVSTLYESPFFRSDALLLGGALALMLRGPEAATVHRLARPFTCVCALLLTLAWLLNARHFHQFDLSPYTPWMATFGLSLVDLTSAGVVLLALRPGALSSLFTVRPLAQLGVISYGFYLFHYIPMFYYELLAYHMCHRFTTHFLIPTLLVAFAGTLSLSLLSYRFLEAPFLRLKDRLTQRPQHPDALAEPLHLAA